MEIFCDVHLWSLRNQTIIPDKNVGIHCYHDKSEGALQSTSRFYEEKKTFSEGRNHLWVPKNRRPERLKDSIREFEDLLLTHACVHTQWMSDNVIQVLLGNCTMVWLVCDEITYDLTNVVIDASLVGKVSLPSIKSAVVRDRHIATVDHESTLLNLIQFGKPISYDPQKKFEKLSSLDPKLSTVNLPGRSGRSVPRRIISSESGGSLLVWWPMASEEAWPWAPMSSDLERANVALLMFDNKQRLQLISYVKTDCDPTLVQFGRGDQTVLTVERSLSSKAGRAEVCTYRTVSASSSSTPGSASFTPQLHRTSHVGVEVGGMVRAAAWSPRRDRLILSSDARRLVMYEEKSQAVWEAEASFLVDRIVWHPLGYTVLLLNSRGDMQIYDRALNCISLSTMNETGLVGETFFFSKFFKQRPILQKVQWAVSGGRRLMTAGQANCLLLVFDRGPVCLLHLNSGRRSSALLSSSSIITDYVKSQHIQKAVSLLQCMTWEVEPQSCFLCLFLITNHLLSQRLSKANEDFMEAALGCFYLPKLPLSEVIILEYRHPVGTLYRRFFHLLLRYMRFDKAYRLAIDIHSRDLFMDIHYAAMETGKLSVAAAAKEKADQCSEEYLDSGSSSCSSCDDEPDPRPGYSTVGPATWQAGTSDSTTGDGSTSSVQSYAEQRQLAADKTIVSQKSNGQQLHDRSASLRRQRANGHLWRVQRDSSTSGELNTEEESATRQSVRQHPGAGAIEIEHAAKMYNSSALENGKLYERTKKGGNKNDRVNNSGVSSNNRSYGHGRNGSSSKSERTSVGASHDIVRPHDMSTRTDSPPQQYSYTDHTVRSDSFVEAVSGSKRAYASKRNSVSAPSTPRDTNERENGEHDPKNSMGAVASGKDKSHMPLRQQSSPASSDTFIEYSPTDTSLTRHQRHQPLQQQLEKDVDRGERHQAHRVYYSTSRPPSRPSSLLVPQGKVSFSSLTGQSGDRYPDQSLVRSFSQSNERSPGGASISQSNERLPGGAGINQSNERSPGGASMGSSSAGSVGTSSTSVTSTYGAAALRGSPIVAAAIRAAADSPVFPGYHPPPHAAPSSVGAINMASVGGGDGWGVPPPHLPPRVTTSIRRIERKGHGSSLGIHGNTLGSLGDESGQISNFEMMVEAGGEMMVAGAAPPPLPPRPHRRRSSVPSHGVTLPGYRGNDKEIGGELLSDQFTQDYAALMVDDPLDFRRDRSERSRSNAGDGGKPSRSVRVIAFGVV